MENSIDITLRPLRLGEILDGAIRLYRRNFWLFVSIIALAEIPFLLTQVVLPLVYTGDFPASDPVADMFSAHWWIINSVNLFVRWIFVDGFGAAALTYAMAQRYLGQKTGILDAYRRPGGSWLSLLVILLLFPALLFATLLWALVPCVGWFSGSGIFIFLSLAVMPLVPAAIMIENQGGLKGLLRAWDLARRRFFWILGFNIVLSLFSWMLSAGPSLVVSLLVTALIGSSLGAAQTADAFYGLVSSVSGTLFNMLFLPIQVGAWTLIYYDLRVRTEAFDLALQAVDATEDANRQVLLPPMEKWLSMLDIAKIILASLLVIGLFALVYIVPIMLLLLIGILAGSGG